MSFISVLHFLKGFLVCFLYSKKIHEKKIDRTRNIYALCKLVYPLCKVLEIIPSNKLDNRISSWANHDVVSPSPS